MQLLVRFFKVFVKSPSYVLKRVTREVLMELDRWRLPVLERRLRSPVRLARQLGYSNINTAWDALAARPFPFVTDRATAEAFLTEADRTVLIERAGQALKRELDLLGSGPISLDTPVDWHRDPKVNHRWPPEFCRRIEYSNPGRPSDVKMPWEISRLQWLMPTGQAYVLTGDEVHARHARTILDEWIAANPAGYSVNWSCTMEPALRILTWVWFFNVFAGSEAWSDPGFRARFLKTLYLHGVFVERHIERGLINGNHYTADAAGMVWAGLFFHGSDGADRWARDGWEILETEIGLQVHPDGVNFEASSAYHRLVAELFWIAAHYRAAVVAVPSAEFAERLVKMGEVTRHMCRPDGTTPNWGDADDARALPFGAQPLGDHRYLPDLIDLTLGRRDTMMAPQGPDQEVLWVFGDRPRAKAQRLGSRAFADGGLFVMRDDRTHVTIDCGPVGLGGLGGHGHNDALSFELWQDGHPLIVDPGSYVYTADFEARNRFRFTASHNTPQIDDEEINRPLSANNLWNLHEDARANHLLFEADGQVSRFAGRHHGYERLAPGVTIERHMMLDSRTGLLTVEDRFTTDGPISGQKVTIPFHLAPDVKVVTNSAGARLTVGKHHHQLSCTIPNGVKLNVEPTEVSPSYGIRHESKKLVIRLPLKDKLTVITQVGPAN
jgi:uncharacterized heparinase superfamily protein